MALRSKRSAAWRVFTFLGLTLLALRLSPSERAAAQYSEYQGMVWDAVPATDREVGWGRAEAVVDAPMARVLEQIHDYGSYHRLVRNFTVSRELSRRGDDALIYVEVTVMRGSVTLWGQLRVLSRAADDGSHRVEATLLRGNIPVFSARWDVRSVDEGRRSRVEFRILVDPEMSVPASIFTDENVRAARKMLRGLRRLLAERSPEPSARGGS